MFNTTEDDKAVSPERLIGRVAQWVQRDDRVIAAALCGSHARGEAGKNSDVDFCLVCARPDALLNDRAWLDRLGPHPRIAGPVEDYGLVRSIRVFYGDTEAEFGIAGTSWIELPVDDGTARVMREGIRVLYDPGGLLEKAIEYASALAD